MHRAILERLKMHNGNTCTGFQQQHPKKQHRASSALKLSWHAPRSPPNSAAQQGGAIRTSSLGRGSQNGYINASAATNENSSITKGGLQIALRTLVPLSKISFLTEETSASKAHATLFNSLQKAVRQAQKLGIEPELRTTWSNTRVVLRTH